MKKLKCESCGGNIEIDENQEYATCPFCKTKYQLNENKNIYIKLDDNTKDLIENTFGYLHNFNNKKAKFVIIPSIAIFIILIVIAVMSATKTNNSFNKNSFNRHYELYSGTEYKLIIESTLDKVVTNNKTNKKHLITVIYKDKETTNPDAIIEIKHSLKDKKYEVKLDYDNDGYVNKITLEDI